MDTSTNVNAENLSARVFSRLWFHRIGLGNGILTPGIGNSPCELSRLHTCINKPVCKKMMILETRLDTLDYRRPPMVFYPAKTLNDDPSNCWGPNPTRIEAILREVEFRNLIVFPPYQSARVVIHAVVQRFVKGELKQ